MRHRSEALPLRVSHGDRWQHPHPGLHGATDPRFVHQDTFQHEIQAHRGQRSSGMTVVD